MENSENKPVDVPVDAPVESASSHPRTSSESQTPLPTYDALNANAPVVTSEVIEERLRSASAKSDSGAAPLANRRDESRRRRENEEKGGEKDGRAPRRERRERSERPKAVVRGPVTHVAVPNRRERLSDDLEDEFNAIVEGQAVDSLMSNVSDAATRDRIEEGTKVSAKVVSIRGDSVFVDVGAREYGIIPLKQFPEDLELQTGQTFDAVVTKFNDDDGVYEVSLPLAAAEVGDWLSLTRGAIVEAVVTGANSGGLECAVGRLRGFMPFSQIAPFRVDNPEQFVGERWKAVVTEINPERRNLVVSRRVLMEKEREEQREKTLAELAEGQSREGLVRKVIDAGAFVDLGGVDGFIPVSMMSWGRVKSPRDVVKEGDRVVVTVVKIDLEHNRISLSLKDAALDPWRTIDSTFQVGDVVRGCVTRVVSFGAFVEIAPGLEGLVHISEIAYQRVNEVSDVLKVGDYVDVKVLAIDMEKRKISLSIKKTREDPREKARRDALAQADADAAVAAAEEKRRDEEALAASRERIRKLQTKKPLKGGLNRGGDNGLGLHF